MAITRIQAHQSPQFDSSTNPVVTTIAATGAGNLLVVCFGAEGFPGSVVTSITDTAGNVYTQVPGAFISGGGSFWVDIWIAVNSIAGATSISCSGASPMAGGQYFVMEYSGAMTSNPVETAAFVPNTTGTPSGPALTTASTSSMLISNVLPFSSSLGAVNAPWADVITGADDSISQLAPGAAGTYTATYSGSQGYTSNGVSILSHPVPTPSKYAMFLVM